VNTISTKSARSICRSLRLNEDLGEALALAHDLGHPPFGHAGEDALREMMEPFGGFDHNAQSLRVITRLEQRYAEFDGLNLTWETLEGLIKHNGPLTGPASNRPMPQTIAEYVKGHDLEPSTHAGAEAQVAALSDDIAYNNHDIDDGLRAGLFTIDDLSDVPLVGPVFRQVRKTYPELDTSRLVHEAVRGLIGHMVHDLVGETQRRIEEAAPGCADDAVTDRAMTPVMQPLLEVVKAANRATAAPGDAVTYEVSVAHTAEDPDLTAVEVVDSLPTGMRYAEGSAGLDGLPLADPAIGPDGSILRFDIGPLVPGQRRIVRYSAIVATDARRGEAINRAFATGTTLSGHTLQSPTAAAAVKIVAGPFRPEAYLAGRVFVDRDLDSLPDDDEDRHRALVSCLRRMRNDLRDLLSRHYGGEHSLRELAEQTDRSYDAVRQSVVRARKWLGDCIERTMREEERR